jgi:hypothetical protein
MIGIEDGNGCESVGAAELKRWRQPKLRIFVKTRAEERVLAGCKVGGYTGPNGPNGGFDRCEASYSTYCLMCSTQSSTPS